MRVAHLLRQAAAEGVAPALAFGIDRAGQTRRWFAGRLQPNREAPLCGPETVFDLASLTKPLCTATWCATLVGGGRLDLATPIGDLLPVTDRALAVCPVRRLLSHTSGLPAHRPYFSGLGGRVLAGGAHETARAGLRRMLLRAEPESEPGQREVYSDLGFLLLEATCEAVDGPLAQRWTSLPDHGVHGLHFRPLPGEGDPEVYAATEDCPWRGRRLVGEVHDENAWTMGGVAGHAGLFGTLDAVLGASRRVLNAVRGDDGLGAVAAQLRAFVDPRVIHPLGTHVLGWDTPTPGASSSGTRFGRRSFGHLGFTGTSVWIDPDADVVMVLLTNRVCPTRSHTAIRALRPALHDAAWDALGGEEEGES